MIAIQTATLPFILISLVVNALVSLTVLNKLCVSHFWILVQIIIAIYTYTVVKLNFWKYEVLCNPINTIK